MAFNMHKYGFQTDICASKNKIQDKAYSVWHTMIRRCYDKSDIGYKNYGAKGIYVSDEFKKYSCFKKWYEENNPTGELVMDKDILGKGYYGKDSILFITDLENKTESAIRNQTLVGKCGQLHPKSKPKEYFETTPVQRVHFKRTCIRQGWNFEDFDEIYSGTSKWKSVKKFYYKEKGVGNNGKTTI